MPLRTLSLDVVGADYASACGKKGHSIPRRYEIALCRPGEPVIIELEPANPFDPQAVRVMSERNIQIGYVRAERASLVGSLIRNGLEVRGIFQAQAAWGAIIRITTDGSEPELPLGRADLRTVTPVARRADPEGDFYPDEVWPDEVWPDEVWPD